jgi:excisionase family DNA binding protein
LLDIIHNLRLTPVNLNVVNGMEQSMKEKNHKKKECLSISEAASFLGMSRISVYKKVKKGEIRSVKIGKIHVIPRLALGEIRGESISRHRKTVINRAVKKVVKEYGELLRKLGNE